MNYEPTMHIDKMSACGPTVADFPINLEFALNMSVFVQLAFVPRYHKTKFETWITETGRLITVHVSCPSVHELKFQLTAHMSSGWNET
jgi:hypothetical protein